MRESSQNPTLREFNRNISVLRKRTFAQQFGSRLGRLAFSCCATQLPNPSEWQQVYATGLSVGFWDDSAMTPRWPAKPAMGLLARSPNRGRRPIRVKAHGSVLHAMLRVSTTGAIHSGSPGAFSASVCIARKVIPRVRPHVYCVQHATRSRDITCNAYCTPLLHATNRPRAALTSQKCRNQLPKPEIGPP